jgi:two-component system, OmpR family, alkaline phosphatase synthesis response regulator PhoP
VAEADLINNQILELIKQKPDITDDEIAIKLGLDVDEVRNSIRRLSDTRVKILIVDDEKDIVVPLKTSLESDNYNVVEAYTGYEAIEKAHFEIPDLVLLDLGLPDIDGYEVCGRMRKDPLTRLIPVIMLTGRDGIDSKIECLNMGADDYITKPFNLDELKARIHTVLRRSMV